MKKYLLGMLLFVLTLQNKAQTVSDVDGNTYNTVTIGTQIWMKENLKTTKYKNGVVIPEDDTPYLTTPAYTWYNNNSATYKDSYGALYNWYVVNTGNLCPTDWHVPTNDEWSILTNFLGGDNFVGGKLKESGLTHWNSPNTGADNSSGFTALPGGQHYGSGGYYGLGNFGIFWSSTKIIFSGAPDDIAYRVMTDNNSIIVDRRFDGSMHNCGHSVRCLKNITSSINISEFETDQIIYPNPAKDKLFIKIGNALNVQIIVFDLQGKEIINMQIGSNPIYISNLSKGIYIVKIIDSGKTVISKLIKE